MAHTLDITSDAFTDISLNSGDNTLVSYAPVDSGNGIVTERAVVRVEGAAATNIQSTLESIKNAFRLANRRHDRGHGDRVYIKFQPDGYSSAYRSELMRRRENEDAGIIIHESDVLGEKWTDSKIRITLEWTRRNYWETNSESELSISNGGGSGTGGQTIYNIHGTEAYNDQTGISFAATNNRISDSNNGLGIFSSGDIISVRGSTSNDGIYSVEEVAGDGSYLDINEDVLSDEAAGDTIDIYDIQNYVHISSSNIDGDLDAAVRIELTNSDAGDNLETVWMGQNALSSPASFPHLLEAGDSDTGSDTADSGSANAIKRTYSIGTSEAKVTGWTLNGEMLTSADGGYFKVFLFTPAGSNVTSVKWRLKILYSGTTIWEGEQITFYNTYATIARAVRAIDSVQLPPFVPENSAPTDLTFELWGESTTGGSVSVDIDCLVLMPLDGYRRLRSSDGIAQNSILKDDTVTGTYYQEVSSAQVRDISAVGKQLFIDPNENNRIYFLLHSVTANTADHDREASIQVYYRARKSSL